MEQRILTVEKNERLTADVFRLVLRGDVAAVTTPGQFVNLKIEGLFLRRPISVCDKGDGAITLVFKVVGEGTARMAEIAPGEQIDVLCGLGNGYSADRSGDRPLLIGGGVGVPPLFWLCRTLVGEGKRPSVIMGFNTADEIFMEDDFRSLGVPVTVTTADGSRGLRGFATDAMAGMDYTYFYTCGPLPMLRAVDRAAKGDGEFSFEERMGCGFGACMGCTHRTKNGHVRICREGPVLRREDVIW